MALNKKHQQLLKLVEPLKRTDPGALAWGEILHINASDEIEDVLNGVAVMSYNLWFANECFLQGLFSKKINIRNHLEIGLSAQKEMWQFAVGERGKRLCRSVFEQHIMMLSEQMFWSPSAKPTLVSTEGME